MLLDIGARSLGAVYFWDHEEEEMEDDPTWNNVYPVTNSFREFVVALH